MNSMGQNRFLNQIDWDQMLGWWGGGERETREGEGPVYPLPPLGKSSVKISWEGMFGRALRGERTYKRPVHSERRGGTGAQKLELTVHMLIRYIYVSLVFVLFCLLAAVTAFFSISLRSCTEQFAHLWIRKWRPKSGAVGCLLISLPSSAASLIAEP